MVHCHDCILLILCCNADLFELCLFGNPEEVCREDAYLLTAQLLYGFVCLLVPCLLNLHILTFQLFTSTNDKKGNEPNASKCQIV